MRENKVYKKPDFTMMCFAANENVAAGSCESYDPVQVNCVISGSHWIFYDACEEKEDGANYDDLNTVTIETTIYFNSDMDVINYLSGSGGYQSSSTSGSIKLTAGDEYLVWYANGNYHAGLITASVTSGINASA